MELEKIDVVTRDQYKGAQEPISFVWRNKEYLIEQVLDRWYEGQADSSRMPLLYFRVKTRSGEVFLIRYHEFFCTWSIRV